ncbi:MAG: hypothetical protein U0X93_11750 [Anaerolineales bacterium]
MAGGKFAEALPFTDEVAFIQSNVEQILSVEPMDRSSLLRSIPLPLTSSNMAGGGMSTPNPLQFLGRAR